MSWEKADRYEEGFSAAAAAAELWRLQAAWDHLQAALELLGASDVATRGIRRGYPERRRGVCMPRQPPAGRRALLQAEDIRAALRHRPPTALAEELLVLLGEELSGDDNA